MIDVDLTLVDTLSPWLRWFKARTGVELKPNAYKVELQMQEHMNEDPMAYWRGKDIYHDLKPYARSVNIVRKLIDQEFSVVFVTYSPFTEQVVSKENWLSDHFGSDIPVIHTHHKELIDADIIIDDNTDMIAKFLDRESSRVGLKYATKLNRGWSAPYPQKSLTMRGWKSIQGYFEQTHGVRF